MDKDHRSNTGFVFDNYDWDVVCKSQPHGWVNFTRGHPCYDPAKARARGAGLIRNRA